MEIKANSVWSHKKEDYVVIIAGLAYSAVKVKDANDARWQSAVGYIVKGEDILRIRTTADFENKFVHLSDDPNYWAAKEK